MSPVALLMRRVPFALLLSVVIVVGTVVGGMAQKAMSPEFERIVWYEHDAAVPGGSGIIRRALFSDGRFVALSPDGYLAGIVPADITGEIFATARAEASSWADAYAAKGPTVELVDIELDGQSTTRITIVNPAMNFGLPSELGRILRLLSAADKAVASLPFAPSSFDFIAAPATAASDDLVGSLPADFPLDQASGPGGVAIAGDALQELRSTWTDLDARLDPSTAYRLVDVQGTVWRIDWRLDLDAMGPLSASSVAP